MASKHNITMQDIADKINMSVVTVSKALREHPDVSFETIKKIKAIAEEMGYLPNYLARNLSARNSNTIGVIVPKIAHYFFGSIIEHIYDIAFENNYEILLSISREDAKNEIKHLQTLMSMKVDGIIISITQETSDFEIFEVVKQRGIPLLFMDRIPPVSGVNSVAIDDRKGAFKAVEQMIKVGYKKIGHFAGLDRINIGLQRYLGFEDAMKKHNIPINPEWVLKSGFGEDDGYNSFMKLYSENNLPDAIFTVTYPVAIGIYKAVKKLGLKISEDIDVICFGDAEMQKLLSPQLSCVEQSTDQIAKLSMEILLDNIKNKQNGFSPRNEIIGTDIILRETCTDFKHRDRKLDDVLIHDYNSSTKAVKA
jgi:LacI family transcriptional regulator